MRGGLETGICTPLYLNALRRPRKWAGASLIPSVRYNAHWNSGTTPAPGPFPMPPSPAPPKPPSHWLLRRADQATVAVLIGAGLLSVIGWWTGHGGLRGRTVEVEQAGPETASFQVDINKADWPELATLPGVGRTMAERIVQSRSRTAPLRTSTTCVGSAASAPARSRRYGLICGQCPAGKPWQGSRLGRRSGFPA